MNYKGIKYIKLKDKLQSMSDEKYKKFNDILIPGIEKISYGVRIPQLRTIAKDIVKDDFKEFVSIFKNSNIYEIKLIHAMVISLAKINFDERLTYVKDFLPKIDNWAICDIFCGSLKSISDNLEETYNFLMNYINSEKEFEARFLSVILMNYFINDIYIDRVFSNLENIKSTKYYAKMAVAWCLSVCFIKYRNKTLKFLGKCNLDRFTYNKSIQKMLESYRINEDDKSILRLMKLK